MAFDHRKVRLDIPRFIAPVSGIVIAAKYLRREWFEYQTHLL
jgi:hypothetical protein